jgi:hypothetical protein
MLGSKLETLPFKRFSQFRDYLVDDRPTEAA